VYDDMKGEARRCTPATQWSMTPCFALFAQIGQVESVTIVTERDTDQSKGSAVVDMGDEDAEQVIAQLNGTKVGGRSLMVNAARPRQERSGRRGDGGYRD
jgi:cold-inducible RNA-binding protein